MTSKYKNVKTEVDNVVFASKKEASRYVDLRALLKSGIIPTSSCRRSTCWWSMACEFAPRAVSGHGHEHRFQPRQTTIDPWVESNIVQTAERRL